MLIIAVKNPAKILEKKTNSNKAKIESVKPIENPQKEIYKCCCCGKVYTNQKTSFPFSQSVFFKGNNNRLPICNHCFCDMTTQYQEKLFDGNEDEAIKRMCLHWDMYLSDELLTASKKINVNNLRPKSYIKNCNLLQYAGKTYDTYLQEQESQAINSLEDFEDAQKESSVKISEKNTIKTWGFGFSAEEYVYLNSQYEDWKSKVVIDGKAKEVLVRDLCVAKLLQQNALLDKNIDLYTNLQKSYQVTLSNANLNPRQEDASDKNGELPLGVMIARFENDQPIPEPMECWKDADGIMKLVNNYFLGHLCKMLDLKNKYSKYYEEEMAKHRVEIPELEELDDEEVFEFLINNGFSDSGDKDGS